MGGAMVGVQILAGLAAAAIGGPSPYHTAGGMGVPALRQVLPNVYVTSNLQVQQAAPGIYFALPAGAPAGSGTGAWTHSPMPRAATGLPAMHYRALPPGAGSYSNPAARYSRERLAAQQKAEEQQAAPSPVEEVIAVGTAPIEGGDHLAARKAAIQDALRNALEKVAGVYVSGNTVAEKMITVSDRVYTRSEGFVVPREILEERHEDGTATVRVRAAVTVRPLLDRLRGLGLTRNWRVAVSIQEGQGTTAPGAAPIAQQAIVERLLQAGFQVMSLPGEGADNPEGLLRSLRGADGPPAADVLVVGTAAARLTTRLPVTANGRVISLVPLYQGRVQARALRVETGEVAASQLADEAVSDPVEALAAGAAVQSSARRVARGFVDEILVLPAAIIRRVHLEVGGFQKRARAQAFEDALPLVAGVRRVQQRGYADGRLTLDVEVDSEAAARLGTELERSPALKEYGVTVESDSKATIRASVTPE